MLKYSHKMKLKIKTLLLLGYLLLGVIAIILSLTSIYFINKLSNTPDKILKDNYKSIIAAQNMIDELDNMDHAVISYIAGSNDKVANEERYEKARSNYYTNFEICEGNITETGEKELIKEIKELSALYITSFQNDKYNLDKISKYDSLILPVYKDLKSKNYQLLNLNHKGVVSRRDESVKISDEAEIYMIIISIVSLIIVIAAIFKIPSLITKPITEFTRKVEAISDKKYSERFETDSENELGILANSFNTMAAKLEEYELSNIEKLIAEKRRAEAIVMSMIDGILVLNEKNEIILVNNTAAELIGMPESALIDKNIQIIANNNNLVKNLFQDFNSSEQDKNKLNYIRIVFKEKEEFFLKEIIKVIDEENSERALGYIVILKNVTGFKELDELKSGFVATVSHELRTPLSAMNMSMRLLEDERVGTMNDEQKKLVGTMKEEVKRLLKMVNELLNLSRMESGGEMLKYQTVRVEEIVDAALTPMLMQLEKKNIILETNIEPALPDLKVDANKISWVLINLLNNAVRYSKENDKIILKIKMTENKVQFSVKDNGKGIEPQYISKIFSKFVQVDAKNIENLNKGVGLGLAISKEFVNAHGGDIWVKSELDKGSEFYFTLPI